MATGRLTRDPDGSRTQTGKSVARLSIAINGIKDGDAVFVDVTVWDKAADFCRDYLTKGSRVFIQGRLQLDRWDDRKTGEQRQKLSIVATSIQSLDSRKAEDRDDNYTTPAPPPPQRRPPPPPPFPRDEADVLPGLEPVDVGEEDLDSITF